ncbi:MAG TPA: CpsB/CapC family capsule biosynthesis tyrosine phosphatase, partial [Chitinophagaceae bacterium]
MFSIFKKKSSSPLDLSWLGVDMHSHLLPGIDDGAQDMTASMEYIRGLAALGYKKIITTPHIYWEMYPNTAEIIKERWGDVKAELDATGIEIELEAAAEYFMDEHFHEELEKKIPLLPLKDNLVLVEFSMVNPPMDLHEVLFEMQM